MTLTLLGMARTGLLEPVLAASQGPVTPASDTALARLVTRGGAPAAALLAAEGPNARFANAGDGIARADPFRAGSITKTFVATVVPQLAAEHRLSLSDSVDDHLPGLARGAGNDGRRITLRAPLRHTSGLYDVTSDTGSTVPLTPFQSVRIAVTHPPTGLSRFAYSNTDYVLLGLVVEQVTGRSYPAEAERRVITPLGLNGHLLPGRPCLPSPAARPHVHRGRRRRHRARPARGRRGG